MLIPHGPPNAFALLFCWMNQSVTKWTRTHSQTAKRLKSGFMWLVLCYHSGGMRANRLQRNRWVWWVIGPHTRRQLCTENCHCMRPQSLLASRYLFVGVSVLWFWKKWTRALVLGQERHSNIFFFGKLKVKEVREACPRSWLTVSDCLMSGWMGTVSVSPRWFILAVNCSHAIICYSFMWSQKHHRQSLNSRVITSDDVSALLSRRTFSQYHFYFRSDEQKPTTHWPYFACSNENWMKHRNWLFFFWLFPLWGWRSAFPDTGSLLQFCHQSGTLWLDEPLRPSWEHNSHLPQLRFAI